MVKLGSHDPDTEQTNGYALVRRPTVTDTGEIMKRSRKSIRNTGGCGQRGAPN